jgi:hypothetical protein
VVAILEDQFDCSLQRALARAATNMSIDDDGEVHYRIDLVLRIWTNARVEGGR